MLTKSRPVCACIFMPMYANVWCVCARANARVHLYLNISYVCVGECVPKRTYELRTCFMVFEFFMEGVWDHYTLCSAHEWPSSKSIVHDNFNFIMQFAQHSDISNKTIQTHTLFFSSSLALALALSPHLHSRMRTVWTDLWILLNVYKN